MIRSATPNVARSMSPSTATSRRRFVAGTSFTGASGSSPSGCAAATAAGWSPGLATAVRGGVHARHEAAVDPRRLAGALLAALERRGVPVEAGAEVVAAERDSGSWRLTTADGRQLAAPSVVLASGAWSGADWLPVEARLPVRPVKGEILTIRGAPDEPVCAGIVAGDRVYVVPRGDGRLIVGATVEEAGFDATVTAGGVHELLREAYRLLPEIAELELAETSAGLRPGTPDNAPLIGLAAPRG